MGIKAEDKGDGPRIKTPEDLEQEFGESLRRVLDDPKRTQRWLSVMRTLSSDGGIRELQVGTIDYSEPDNAATYLNEEFSKLSSGHKIVLLTMTKLVEFVSDRTLVLLDEPETHLHPPLLSSFVRALSGLLDARNGVALVATHSPVVLQEVPASCVSIVVRSGSTIRVVRPEDETFAENVSVLTRTVFGLEVEQSGFYKLLRDASLDGRTYSYVTSLFQDQIGSEGRALTRTFISDIK